SPSSCASRRTSKTRSGCCWIFDAPMGRSKKRRPNLAEDLDILLGDLCRECGFCNGLTGASIVSSQETISAVNFSLLVLRAEGMEPDPHLEWSEKIARAFRDRYGDEIDEEKYSNTR
ncbi:MAG: hypothetical protein WD076_09510, partial [Parvularculaceae bacterium]